MIIVTTDTLPGHVIRSVIGVVDSQVYAPYGAFAASTGNLGAMRSEVWTKLGEHAAGLGANAIIGFRFETLTGTTDTSVYPYAVLAYGTAVVADASD